MNLLMTMTDRPGTWKLQPAHHSVKQTSILLHTSIHISHGHSFFKIRIGVEVILFYNYLLTVCITSLH